MSETDAVRAQYERFPYPKVSLLSEPLTPEADPSLESIFEMIEPSHRPHALPSHRGARILVVGCGTFEAAGVALLHPFAQSITALDLSARSLKLTEARIRNLLRRGRLVPKLTYVRADLEQDSDFLAVTGDNFDYILASNVLHHLADPLGSLARISRLLAPHGILRMRVYPPKSRAKMDELAQYFKSKGLTAQSRGLILRTHFYAWRLPRANPMRATFFTNPERTRLPNLVDAFFHARVNSPSFTEWGAAAMKVGLTLLREDTQQVDFKKLDELDAGGNLGQNPIFWFQKL